MSKYLNPKSDRTFKKAFCEHKELFLTVLNAMQPGCEIKSLEDLPAEIAADSLVAKALSLVEESAYTDAELLAIEKYWDQVSRERTALNAAERKGRAEGEAIGIAKGEAMGVEKRNAQIARNLKTMGLSYEQISQATGLTADEISSL